METWIDDEVLVDSLADRLPGQSAREKADEIRSQSSRTDRLRTVLGGPTDERSWRNGSAGEVLVAAELRRLDPSSWTVIHDIPIGHRGANLDHLVIGPAGVFSLNTKNLRGNVWVAERVFMHNGHRTDYLPKANKEARRVSQLLSAATGGPVPVRGLLVVICNYLKIKAQPKDVSVVGRWHLRESLERLPHVLSRQEAWPIAGAAMDPRTWS